MELMNGLNVVFYAHHLVVSSVEMSYVMLLWGVVGGVFGSLYSRWCYEYVWGCLLYTSDAADES